MHTHVYLSIHTHIYIYVYIYIYRALVSIRSRFYLFSFLFVLRLCGKYIANMSIPEQLGPEQLLDTSALRTNRNECPALSANPGAPPQHPINIASKKAMIVQSTRFYLFCGHLYQVIVLALIVLESTCIAACLPQKCGRTRNEHKYSRAQMETSAL